MINLKMLLKNAKFEDQTQSIKDNLLILLEKLSKIEAAYGQNFIITSGLRTKEDQLRIYKAKGVPDNKIPWGSAHLKGAAADVSDPNGKLIDWCYDNVQILENIGLWCEEKDSIPRVHFQIYPPKSGNRFFKP